MPRLLRHLRIANFRQFREVNLDFHEKLTVLTGPNGAGKTTILNLLSRHFGWGSAFVGTPRRNAAGLMFSADIWSDAWLAKYAEWLQSWSALRDDPPAVPQPTTEQEIGTLTYADDRSSRMTVPANVGAQFYVNFQNQQQISGLHIPSHRPFPQYQQIQSIPAIPRPRDQAFNTYTQLLKNRYYGQSVPNSPSHYLKETLIAHAAFGYGNQVIDRNPDSLELFEGFENVLRTVLPPSLGFIRFSIRLPEVVLVTQSGDFSLDAVSGGIAAIIDLAWQIYMYAKPDTPFVATIDEPENHLHPELQRTVLGTFLAAFPHVQFICATHNPFIVTSVPDSNVYALRYGGDDHRVRSELLSSLDRAGSSNEVLRDILGLPSSSPKWVETRLHETTDALAERELTPALIDELRRNLEQVGLGKFLPETLARLAKDRLIR